MRVWRSRGSKGLWWLAGSALLLVAASAATVSRLEESDPFCIACHTAPEVTYYGRAQQALGEGPTLDLSSAHYTLAEEGFRCIDCHRGDGSPAHRVITLGLGARDALIYLAGRADPAIEKGHARIEAPVLLTAACVKCHADSLLVTGFENHFHNKLPAAYDAWRAGGRLTAPADLPEAVAAELMQYDTSVLCVDCHRAHIHVDGAELTQWLDVRNVVYPACVQCHKEVEQGPLELAGR